MFRSLFALFKRRPRNPFLGTDAHPEPENWRVKYGAAPDWVRSAFERDEIVPVPRPGGTLDWGGNGVQIVKTGRFIPLGRDLHRDDLAF